MAKSKTSRAPGLRVHRQGKSSPRDAEAHSSSGRAALCHLSGRRLWLVRSVSALLAPIVFLLLLEIALSVAGFGRPATFFVGGGKEGTLTTNFWYIWFYRPTRTTSPHPSLIQAAKPRDTIRLFVLGESAAMGTPDPAYSFGRILELMLQQRFPDHRVEVVNAAMRGIDSHVVAGIARQCARQQPDLFVVYMGNNEVIGQYGPTTFLSHHPGLIGALHRVKETRVAQGLRIAMQGIAADQSDEAAETMESFRQSTVALDDPTREMTYRNYRRNLRRICDSAVASGAGVVLATVAVNLKDCPPLASLHRSDLTSEQLLAWETIYQRAVACEDAERYADAIAAYQQAATLDEHYADLHFRLARCHLALGDRQSAKTHFSLARDWDALQFRTDSRLNDIVRATASEYADRKVRLVDADRDLAAGPLCPDGVAGASLFNDHVHCTFEGDYQLARLLLPAVTESLRQDRDLAAAETADVPSLDDCAKRLAFTAWDRVNTVAGIAKMLACPPFLDQLDHASRQAALEQRIAEEMGRVDQAFVDDVVRSYEEAIALDPDDWALRYNYANFLYQLKRYQQATPHIRYVANRFGAIPAFHVLLGYCLAGSGHLDQGLERFRLAHRLDRHSQPINEALAWARQRQRDLRRRASK